MLSKGDLVQYKLPSGIHPNIEVLADIEENRDELLAQLRAEVPKDCAKCGSLDIGPGGILCDRCNADIARHAFDIPAVPERWGQPV